MSAEKRHGCSLLGYIVDHDISIVFRHNRQSRLENDYKPEYAGIALNRERISIPVVQSQEGTS
jgi:hypothetical protein